MRISDWSSDVCSSDLPEDRGDPVRGRDCDQIGGGRRRQHAGAPARPGRADPRCRHPAPGAGRELRGGAEPGVDGAAVARGARSEEHTSELQSLMRISYAVFCLKTTNNIHITVSLYKQKMRNNTASL